MGAAEANENPVKEFPIPRSYVPLKSALHCTNEVDGFTSGPKNSKPPFVSPHPTGVPICAVSIFVISVGIERNKSNSAPPVPPLFVNVN